MSCWPPIDDGPLERRQSGQHVFGVLAEQEVRQSVKNPLPELRGEVSD